MPDEYKTTRARVHYSGEYDVVRGGMLGQPDPIPPHGEGWVLTSSTSIALPGVNDKFIVLWFWRRRPPRLKTAPCKGCGALARKQGVCIGCGERVTHA